MIPPPSALAVETADRLTRSLPADILVDVREEDVIGGLALWLKPTGGSIDPLRWALLSIRNNGKVLLTLDEHIPGGQLSVHPYDSSESTHNHIREFFHA